MCGFGAGFAEGGVGAAFVAAGTCLNGAVAGFTVAFG
jgi:hypothetical protein